MTTERIQISLPARNPNTVRRNTNPLPQAPSVQPVGKPEPAQPTTLPQPTPKGVAETNPEYHSVVLPSNFFFYPWKELGAKLVRGVHQAKFNAAASNNSLRTLVEAVSSLISQSAYDLTVKDFTWLMYWLRKNSYTKTTMQHVAVCSNPQHLQDVDDGKKDARSLETIAFIRESTLKETAFDPKSLENLPFEEDLAGLQLGPPRMCDIVELVEAIDRPDFEEFSYLAELASCLGNLDAQGRLMSLSDRVRLVSDFSPDQTSALREYLKVIENYGVQEELSVKCEGCGAEIRTSVTISASSFL